MAHKKGVGSTDNGRDSKSKRLGVKLFGGEKATAGNILIRQRGTKYHPGLNVYMGRDHTLHAAIDGVVVYKRAQNDRVYVNIQPPVVETVDTPVKPFRPKVKGNDVKATPSEKPATAKKSAAQPVETAEPAAVEMPEMEAAPKMEASATQAETMEETSVEATTSLESLAEAPAVEEAVETPVIEAAPETEESPVAKAPAVKKEKGPKLDDLKIVEGIGPKIEQLLKEGGINTWEELANAPVDRLREILDAAGSRYQIHDPGSWPAQAKFAAAGQWEELKEYQDMLTGGRDVTE